MRRMPGQLHFFTDILTRRRETEPHLTQLLAVVGSTRNFKEGLTWEPVAKKIHQYDGRITDAAIDGSIDYKGRPANKATTGRWHGVSYIMVAVVLERMAYYGIALNLVTYLTKELHEGSAESTTNVWNWGGVAWILPLAGGFIADRYLGRFLTVSYSFVIYLTGMILLTLTVSLSSLKPPPCPTQSNCKNASKLSVGLFYLALYIVAVGVGGIKPCISALGADQFDEEDAVERPMKRSFFNYWWVAVSMGAFLSLTVLVYVEDRVGFNWGYGIPTVGLAIAMVFFFLGTRTYRYKRPIGSPLVQVAQVLVAAVRNYRVRVPDDPNMLHEVVDAKKRSVLHTNHFRFLDKAATRPMTNNKSEEIQGPITSLDSTHKPDVVLAMNNTSNSNSNWKLCTVTHVEEVKLLARVMPVWLTTLVFLVTVQQLSVMFLQQGLTMDLHMGPHFRIPAASLELTCTITALLAIPLYDAFFVPFVRRITGNERGLSLLQRIGVGLVISVVGMAVAAIVEIKRMKVIRDNGLQNTKVALPMSVFWLTPQYSIMGLAQVFGYMGQLEFFYDQVPDNMQSIGTALFTSNTGVAHFLCTAILHIVTSVTGRNGHKAWVGSSINNSRLDKYYWMLTALSAVNFLAFFVVSQWYTYKVAVRPGRVDQKKVVPEKAAPLVE